MGNFKSTFAGILLVICAAAFLNCSGKTVYISKSEYKKILPDERFTLLRKKIPEDIKQSGAASLSLAVEHNGEIIWQEAFGLANIEKSIEAAPHTMYSLASISKPITATGLMLLVERGKIDLDGSADKYLGSARLTAYEGEVQNATVKKILNHTSGLPRHVNFFFENENYPLPSMEETIRRYGIFINEPGEMFNYSNIGYGIIDYIITTVSNTKYPDFMQSEVFQPLGMKRTAVITHSSQLSDDAQRYDNNMKPYPFYDFDHRGASAIYSTAHDLLLFGMFHLKQVFPGQKNILTDETIDLMKKAEANMGPNRLYGLGWMIIEKDNGYRTVYHSGSMHGVRTILKLVPSENIVVSVLCNNQNNISLRTADDIISILLPDFGENRSKTEQQQKVTEKVKIPEEYIGNWTGKIKTHEGTMPISMKIQPEFKINVKLSEQSEQEMYNVRMERNMLRGEFNGEVDTNDAGRRSHRIDMQLKYRRDRISGSATAQSSGFALTSWIVLQKK